MCLVFLNLVINTIMASFMGIYTWNNPDRSECYSWRGSDAAIENPIGIDEPVWDVTRLFHYWFFWGFILSVLALSYSIFSIVFVCSKKLIFLRTANSCMALALLGNLGWTVCGTVFRYRHHGMVCSGDFFNDELYRRIPPFQWKSGQFIFVYLIILWGFWGFLLAGGCVGGIITIIKGKNKD